MFLALELLFIVLLAVIFTMLYKNDAAPVKNRLHRAVLREYWNGRERRKHIRFRKSLEVVYTIMKKPHIKNNCRTIDISEGGMKLLMDRKLSNGTILNLKVAIPGAHSTVDIEGVVAWSEESAEKDRSGKRFFLSGVEFSAIREPSSSGFIDYIRSLSSEALEDMGGERDGMR